MIRLKSLLFEQETKKKLNVLFVGDSQTASGISYANKLIKSGVVSGKVVASVGASMSKIYGLFKSAYKPGVYDIVSVLGGNNDAGNNNFDTDSFAKIITTAVKNKSKVILITCPTMQYINTSMYPNDYSAAPSISKWQAGLAGNGVTVIDSLSILNDKRYFAKDGLHLNEFAQNALMQLWLNKAAAIKPGSVDNTAIGVNDQFDIKFGAVSQQVKAIQKRLIELNYSVGPEMDDSVFGPHTQNGVETFQKVNGLKVTGQIDKQSLDLLMSPNAKECPPELRQKDLSQSIDISLTSSQTGTIKTIVDFFVSKGLTKEQGLGIAANLQAESGLRTGAIGDSGTSMGLAQWHNERMNNLINWTKQNNLDPNSVKGQLEFLWYELTTSESGALRSIKSTSTTNDAAYAFTVNFERPANKHVRGLERAQLATSLESQIS